jgi:uncharacterized protein YndB with AHSA1/START domain
MTGYVATAEIDIGAPPARVWDALTDPDQVRRFMFDTTVETDWKPGSPIVWKGVYQGKEYEDRGEIIAVEAPRLLVMTHFSPLSGQEDRPENYHKLTYELQWRGVSTRVRLSQDNNAGEDEAEHSRGMWESMLSGLKQVVEGNRPQDRA